MYVPDSELGWCAKNRNGLPSLGGSDFSLQLRGRDHTFRNSPKEKKSISLVFWAFKHRESVKVFFTYFKSAPQTRGWFFLDDRSIQKAEWTFTHRCFTRTSESSMWPQGFCRLPGGSQNICYISTIIMQHPLEIGAHYYPPDVHPDQRSHRYRSFMIEEILTDHPDHKVSSPTGDLLKFGVHALLSARPYHNHLGKNRDLWVRQYFEIRHGESFNLNLLLIRGHSNRRTSLFAYSKRKDSRLSLQTNTKHKSLTEIYAMQWTEQAWEHWKSIQAFFVDVGKKTLATTINK